MSVCCVAEHKKDPVEDQICDWFAYASSQVDKSLSEWTINGRRHYIWIEAVCDLVQGYALEWLAGRVQMTPFVRGVTELYLDVEYKPQDFVDALRAVLILAWRADTPTTSTSATCSAGDQE